MQPCSPPPRPAIRSLWRGCCANCSPTSAAMQGTSAIARRPLRTWFREVILLRDMEQLTISEAADRLGITREACKSRIHRGRALLREYLQGDESRGGKK